MRIPVQLLPLSLMALAALASAQDQDEPWEDEEWDSGWGDEEMGLVWTGFVEAAFGTRLSEDPLIDSRNTLEDVRWRVETTWQPQDFSVAFKADAGYDGIERSAFADIRELSVAFTLGGSTDVLLGRQVQTWGTGDLLFLNDLFPKDFVSFFAGRDDEYLKAPGNAIRLTHYTKAVNIDFVWTPVFEPDVYLTGERFSFFSPLAGRNVAPEPPLSAIEPDERFANGEFALRIFRTVEGREYAAYAYRGFFKQPNALTPALEATFAPLGSLGASIRQPLGPGLFNSEVSYYASRDDGDGTDPLLPNDQLRVLFGYEWEAKPRFTVGLQYYLEWTLDHDELLANSPFPQFEPDEVRHLVTNRLTYRTNLDKFTWSLFTFYSPSDSDFYLRPQFVYRHSDRWSVAAGGNLFGGSDAHTFFSQLQDATNAYVRIRLSY